LTSFLVSRSCAPAEIRRGGSGVLLSSRSTMLVPTMKEATQANGFVSFGLVT